MITKEMYQFLKQLPRWPENKSFDEIVTIRKKDKIAQLGMMMEARKRGLIGCNGKEEDNTAGYYLDECGQEAIDEYKRQLGADRKATWAIIISGLSLVVAIVAIVVSCVVQ